MLVGDVGRRAKCQCEHSLGSLPKPPADNFWGFCIKGAHRDCANLGTYLSDELSQSISSLPMFCGEVRHEGPED